MDTIENCWKGNQDDTVVIIAIIDAIKTTTIGMPFILQRYHQHL